MKRGLRECLKKKEELEKIRRRENIARSVVGIS